MNKRSVLILVFVAAIATAQTSLRAPQFGLIRDRAGSMRPLGGSAGSFLAGESQAEGATGAVWCGTSGLIRTDSDLQWISKSEVRRVADSPGRLLCADGVPARQNNTRLERWTGETFEPWPLEFSGEVLAMDNGTVLLRDDTGLTLVTLDARRQSVLASRALPVAADRATLLAGSVLYQQGSELVLWSPDGRERRSPLPLCDQTEPRPSGSVTTRCELQFEPLGPGWIHAFDFNAGVDLAVRVKADELQVFELPGVQQ